MVNVEKSWEVSDLYFRKEITEDIVQFLQDGVAALSCAVSEVEHLEEGDMKKYGESFSETLSGVVQACQDRVEALLYDKQYDDNNGEEMKEALCTLGHSA